MVRREVVDAIFSQKFPKLPLSSAWFGWEKQENRQGQFSLTECLWKKVFQDFEICHLISYLNQQGSLIMFHRLCKLPDVGSTDSKGSSRVPCSIHGIASCNVHRLKY